MNLNGQARWLPTREPKRKTAADKAWPHAYAIELDAIAPDDLRRMVQKVIEYYPPPDQLEVVKAAEASERSILAAWAGALGEGEP